MRRMRMRKMTSNQQSRSNDNANKEHQVQCGLQTIMNLIKRQSPADKSKQPKRSDNIRENGRSR